MCSLLLPGYFRLLRWEDGKGERKGGDKETHVLDRGAHHWELDFIGLKELEHNPLITIPRKAVFCDRQSEMVGLRACAHLLGLVTLLFLFALYLTGL
jgi:hypothetical protein